MNMLLIEKIKPKIFRYLLDYEISRRKTYLGWEVLVWASDRGFKLTNDQLDFILNDYKTYRKNQTQVI